MNERKDIDGNIISIGDRVAYNRPYYKGFTIGIVTGFTPKGFKIDNVINVFSLVKLMVKNDSNN